MEKLPITRELLLKHLTDSLWEMNDRLLEVAANQILDTTITFEANDLTYGFTIEWYD